MKFDEVKEVKQSRPITRKRLLKVARRVDKSVLDQLLRLTLSFLAHDGVMRGKELFSGIKVGDIEWAEDLLSFTLKLWRTKTVRSGGGVKIEFAAPAPDLEGGETVCAVTLMRELFDALGLWGRDDHQVFPRLEFSSGKNPRIKGIDFSSTYCRRRWIAKLQVDLRNAGCGEGYTGHGCRAGAATDLFESGESLPTVMDAGRWNIRVIIRDRIITLII